MNSIKINGKDRNLKDFLLNLFNSGIRVVKPNLILDKYLKIQKKVLLVNINHNKYIKYKNIEKIYILCIGKASVETAETINKIFKNSDLKIQEGIVVSNKENFRKVKNFKCFSSTLIFKDLAILITACLVIPFKKQSGIRKSGFLFLNRY